jgi:hypothetical protein
MRLQTRCKSIVDSKVWILSSSIITLYCLFGPDVNTIAFTKTATSGFDGLTLFSLVFFSLELVLTCIGSPGYMWSFFFVLDVIATATIPFDLSYVAALFVNSSISGASRASRAGTRATRIIRVLRLIRLFRISRLFKSFRKATGADVDEAGDPRDKDDWSETSTVLKHQKNHNDQIVESDIGKRLSEQASKRVVVLVLTMMFVIPQLNTAAQFAIYPSLDHVGIDNLRVLYSYLVRSCREGALTAEMRLAYERHLLSYIEALHPTIASSAPGYDSSAGNRIAWITLSSDDSDTCMGGANSPWLSLTSVSSAKPGYTELYRRLRYDGQYRFQTCETEPGVVLASGITCPDELRLTDLSFVFSTHSELVDDGIVMKAVIDIREANISDAFLSIYRTLVICVILGIGTYVFSNSAFALVLEPVERMMNRVDRIRSNPLLATQMHDNTTSRHDEKKLKALAKYNTSRNFLTRWNSKRELLSLYQTSMETEMLEKTIMRIGGLLAVGFGPAGADIVARNMASSAAGLNVMLPGKRVEAIFGFIRIQDFGIVAGVLRQRVMNFVNQISEIVLGIADEFHGIVNRCDGESFQVVWKLDPTLNDTERIQVHDMAIAACVKMIIAIGRSLALNEYRNVPPIVLKIPNFRVRISFGLHKGWAIEGAIGSLMKIDPSYLSADVNVAETIQKLNESYQTTTLLLSETVYKECSKNMQSLMRLVDRVKIRSRRIDLSIYSLDLDNNVDLLTSYEIENMVYTTQTTAITSRSRLRSERESRKARKLTLDMVDFLHDDKYFHVLRGLFSSSPLFMETFRAGVLNFQCGEWGLARRMLETCLVSIECQEHSLRSTRYEDGVCKFLLRYMNDINDALPPGWGDARVIA